MLVTSKNGLPPAAKRLYLILNNRIVTTVSSYGRIPMVEFIYKRAAAQHWMGFYVVARRRSIMTCG